MMLAPAGRCARAALVIQKFAKTFVRKVSSNWSTRRNRLALLSRCDFTNSTTPSVSMLRIRLASQSICCSVETSTLLSSEGLPGPTTISMLGKPDTETPS